MSEWISFNNEFFFIAGIIYLFLVITVAKIGSGRACGGLKSFLVSLLFTPIVGLIYVLNHLKKDMLKITHYRCPACRLEYTSKYRYCPACEKDGKSNPLEKISMKSY
jgi:hypothetical protein